MKWTIHLANIRDRIVALSIICVLVAFVVAATHLWWVNFLAVQSSSMGDLGLSDITSNTRESIFSARARAQESDPRDICDL